MPSEEISKDQPTDARSRLSNHFSSTVPSEHGPKWDALWNEGFVPWDKGSPNPALIDLLSERQDLFPSFNEGHKKALVPGCGKGYDVLLLSAFGYDAYGLEVSKKALERCKAEQGEKDGKGIYKTREGVEKGKVKWLSGDFFKSDFLKDVEGEGTFDLIYDYTFLSALPPSLRPAWSKRLNELLAPEGRLICLEFPTYKPPSTGGPPWALPPKIYTAHLPRPGKELPYAEDGELKESKIGEPSKEGLQRIVHIKPKRTHGIGYAEDGSITDWISLWAHPNR